MIKTKFKNRDRRKAFIGAIIGSVANIAGGIISAKKKKKAEENAFAQQQQEQTRSDGVAQASALTTALANDGYVNDFNKKITLKNGGKVKNKGMYRDRKKKLFGTSLADIGKDFNKENVAGTIEGIGTGIANAFAPTNSMNKGIADGINTIGRIVGGRRKAAFGIGEAAGGVGNLVGALTMKTAAPKMIKKSDGFNFGVGKASVADPSYQLDANGNPITVADPNVTVNDTIYDNRNGIAKMGKRVKYQNGGKKQGDRSAIYDKGVQHVYRVNKNNQEYDYSKDTKGNVRTADGDLYDSSTTGTIERRYDGTTFVNDVKLPKRYKDRAKSK